MNKIRILLVNKDDVYRRYMQYRLEIEEDLEVVGSYPFAEEALPYIETLTPNIILIDSGFPKVNSIETCRQIVSKRRTCDVIMLVSAQELINDDPIDGVANDSHKKIDFKALISSIRRVYKWQLPEPMDGANKRIAS